MKMPIKRSAATEALKELSRRRKQIKLIKLFGEIDFDPDYDYKAQRNVEKEEIIGSEHCELRFHLK